MSPTKHDYIFLLQFMILNFHSLSDWIQIAHVIFIIWQDRKSEPSDKLLLNQDLPYGPFSWKYHKPCIFLFFFCIRQQIQIKQFLVTVERKV